ncbi:hypothetical protein CCACVL1_29166 [Corchorus capsularis]|uniref:PGG domain-containing protein n=1 Tax=Corchorus capsularis TaxID=210143 RepID=A0A1R3G3H1_COCAP|nr:hypothetical protein CCACVL1_29166 [Corchorus capsularis]
MDRISYMDGELFKAAEHGDVEVLFNKYEGSLDRLVDGQQNSTPCLRHERRTCPLLVLQANARGEIPLHIAARHGHYEIVEFLIKRSKEQRHGDLEQMVRMRDKDQNTALHQAAQYAARGGRFDLVAEILDANCEAMALVGPYGRTILHAATLADDEETVKIILGRKKHLTKEGDEEYGQTPLHYAAHGNLYSVAEALLENDDSAAYLTDKERGMSPLHMAALQGNVIDSSITINLLLHDKDANGITPFHVARYRPAAHGRHKNHPLQSFKVPVWDENSQGSEKKKKIEEVLEAICNIEVAGLPVVDSIRTRIEGKNNVNTGTDDHERIRETHLLVAAPVATVTFTAAFTVPGGYKSEKGTAILSPNAAFQAFVITDSLAFVCSLSAVWIHILIVHVERNTNFYKLLYHVVDPLTGFGMIAMVIAFTTGIYAVLGSSLGLAIAACAIANTFFLIILYAHYKSRKVYDWDLLTEE